MPPKTSSRPPYPPRHRLIRIYQGVRIQRSSISTENWFPIGQRGVVRDALFPFDRWEIQPVSVPICRGGLCSQSVGPVGRST